MCSINEEDLEVMPDERVGNEPLSELCKKCGGMGSVVLRRKDVYCTNCFAIAINHKFRASLGKNKTIRTNQKVAVGVSGGLASSVLLDFVHNGLNEDAHKKLRIDAVCIYIDDDFCKETCMKNSEFVLKQTSQYGLPLYINHLSASLEDNTLTLEPNKIPTVDLELLEKLKKLVNSTTSSTSRMDLMEKLHRKLMLQCANELQCSFILVGENSTSLASMMLSNLTLGRGSQIENDVGFCDSRDSVKILKPIKDVTNEELKYYIQLKNIPHLPKKALPGDSIQHTIGKFILGLQENFPATISTICRTAEKMGDSEQSGEQCDARCILCQSILDTQESRSSALQATNFSRLVSSTGPHHSLDSVTTRSPCSNCSNCSKSVTRDDIDKYLCYGCRLILRDVKDVNVIEFFQGAIKQKVVMAKLRDEINDFLI